MTYIVTDNCIACKYTDCVEVCPVDCFYEGENMLVIHPDECIDCGVCEPECPADAIRPDTEPDLEKWVEFNRKYSEEWPVIITKKDPRTILIDPDATSYEPEGWRDVIEARYLSYNEIERMFGRKKAKDLEPKMLGNGVTRHLSPGHDSAHEVATRSTEMQHHT